MRRTIILPVLASILILGGFGLNDAFAGDAEITLKGQPFKELREEIGTIQIEIEELKLVSHQPIPIFGDPDFDVAEIFDDPDFGALFGDPDFDTFLIESLQDTDEDLQTQIDSFFDIFVDLDGNRIDSFFDVFTEISVHEEDMAQEQAARIAADEQLITLDQKCTSPQVMVGIDANGIIICDLVQDTPPPVPILESCNGLDDDSDPTTPDGADETWLGDSCDGPDTDACSEGVSMCTGGGRVCSDTTDNSEEIPGDGIDNDCDEAIDETS